jgi:hypothetical protein
MKNFIRLIILFFTLTTAGFAQAGIPLRNGNLLLELNHVNAGIFRSYLNVSADGFQFSMAGGDDLVTYPNVGTIHRGGETIVQSRTFSEPMRGPGTVNNTDYQTLFLFNSFNPATVLSFECADFTIPYAIISRRQATYQTPCKMKGNLYLYASPTSQTILFSSPVYGEAIANLKFERYTFNQFPTSRYKYLLRSVNYVFVNP